MTQSQHPPLDPDTVAEIAPGRGPSPARSSTAGARSTPTSRDRVPGGPAAGDSVTTEAGTFEDLPVGEADQGE